MLIRLDPGPVGDFRSCLLILHMHMAIPETTLCVSQLQQCQAVRLRRCAAANLPFTPLMEIADPSSVKKR